MLHRPLTKADSLKWRDQKETNHLEDWDIDDLKEIWFESVD
jgi:hypothetical protein